MKRYTTVIMALPMLAILLGCGATAKMITARSQSDRVDIFQEISGGEPIPAGYADLVIKASIKTHLVGYYGDESIESAHGKEFYPYLINIDGQAVHWNVQGKRHELPVKVDGTTSRDPEAGTGMKYVLEKRVRLAAGMHKVFFGLPEEPYYAIADIALKSGESHTLEFKPKYGHKHVPVWRSTFLKGIYMYEVSLDGARVD